MRRHSHKNELAWNGDTFLNKVLEKMNCYYRHSYAELNTIYLGRREVAELTKELITFQLTYVKSDCNEFMGMRIIHVDERCHMDVAYIK
jgi:hypothetical protein